jgi:multiple antibiotic resistance protein
MVSGFLAIFIEAFLPLFVAVNIPGILPLYIGMTETMESKARGRLLVQAIAAAVVLALFMLFAGDVIFAALGITVNDLRVGGGLILLIIAILDLVAPGKGDRRTGEAEHDDGTDPLSVVPLGIPLIMGPAAITTIIVSQGRFGYVPTLSALLAVMALVYLAFTFGPKLMAIFGPSTSKAVAKVASLFLAAISVAMIRTGILNMVAAG